MALKLLGILAALTLAWLMGALALMVTVGVVHSWWPFIPTMPYTVALAIAGIKFISAIVGQIFGETIKEGVK